MIIENNKKCFFITPIGNEGSETRRNINSLEAVLKPVLMNIGYDLILPHKISKIGTITLQIIEEIKNADLVIANLTGLNPNVMYELAYRHSLQKEVICIAEKGTILPFDILTERVIFYENCINGEKPLINQLYEYIYNIEIDNLVLNPIVVSNEFYKNYGNSKILIKALKNEAMDNNQRFYFVVIEFYYGKRNKQKRLFYIRESDTIKDVFKEITDFAGDLNIDEYDEKWCLINKRTSTILECANLDAPAFYLFEGNSVCCLCEKNIIKEKMKETSCCAI